MSWWERTYLQPCKSRYLVNCITASLSTAVSLTGKEACQTENKICRLTSLFKQSALYNKNLTCSVCPSIYQTYFMVAVHSLFQARRPSVILINKDISKQVDLPSYRMTLVASQGLLTCLRPLFLPSGCCSRRFCWPGSLCTLATLPSINSISLPSRQLQRPFSGGC